MAKGKNPRPSPAEEYLAMINPDKPFRSHYRRVPSRSDIEPKYRYRPVYKKVNEIPEDPISRIFYRMNKSLNWFTYLLGGGLLAVFFFYILDGLTTGDPYFLSIFIVGLFVFLVVILAIRDGSRPPKKEQDKEEDRED